MCKVASGRRWLHGRVSFSTSRDDAANRCMHFHMLHCKTFITRVFSVVKQQQREQQTSLNAKQLDPAELALTHSETMRHTTISHCERINIFSEQIKQKKNSREWKMELIMQTNEATSDRRISGTLLLGRIGMMEIWKQKCWAHPWNFHWIQTRLCWLVGCRRQLSELHMQISALKLHKIIDDFDYCWLDNWYLWSFCIYSLISNVSWSHRSKCKGEKAHQTWF